MILYYVNVGLICLVSGLQWWHFRYRVKGVEFDKSKLILIFAILFVAYLFRAIINQQTELQLYIMCYNYPNNWAWYRLIISS
jgi:hypothetical protein